MIYLLRRAQYPLPQIRPVLDELRRSGGTDALRAAVATRRSSLTSRALALVEAAGHLHDGLTADRVGGTASPSATTGERRLG